MTVSPFSQASQTASTFCRCSLTASPYTHMHVWHVQHVCCSLRHAFCSQGRPAPCNPPLLLEPFSPAPAGAGSWANMQESLLHSLLAMTLQPPSCPVLRACAIDTGLNVVVARLCAVCWDSASMHGACRGQRWMRWGAARRCCTACSTTSSRTMRQLASSGMNLGHSWATFESSLATITVKAPPPSAPL